MRPRWWTNDHWATPPEFVRNLENEFGRFDLDPCCMPRTAKACRFFTPAMDGLVQPWHGRVFLNPPYSKLTPWLEKAALEIGVGRAEIIVALLPASTDTAWFHELVKTRAEVRFLRGRVKFLGWRGTPIGRPKMASMLAIYR